MATFNTNSSGLNGDTTAPRTPSSDNTGGAQFHAFVEYADGYDGEIRYYHYQSITFQEQFRTKSPEELRLEDYKQNRCRGIQGVGGAIGRNNELFSASSGGLFSARKRKAFPAYDEQCLIEENKQGRAWVDQTYVELHGIRKERMSELEMQNAELRKEVARQEKQIAALQEEKDALNDEVRKFTLDKKSVQELLDAGRKL
ncbi:unnamed protein product [Zymoseptoria tritici ST99CH_3D1]|nr:unnamed protein product [Zymoseptoria tritici ST99CH_3D1]